MQTYSHKKNGKRFLSGRKKIEKTHAYIKQMTKICDTL